MRVIKAFKVMLIAAVHNPCWAIFALLHTVVSKGGLTFIMTYFAIVLVTGIVASQALMSAGADIGTWQWLVANIVFHVGMGLLLVAMLAPVITLHFGDIDADTHGSARFATQQEIAPFLQLDAGVLIGRDIKTGQPLRYDGPAHLLTMAPTRTGKGVGTIIPNLLTADRSILCIDPKGENAKITHRARETFGPVHVLDPFRITGLTCAAFNPLDTIDPNGVDIAEDVSALADALVHDELSVTGEAHWNEEAKALISGLLLKIITQEPRHRRTLTTLRECLTLPPEAFVGLLKEMQNSDAARGLVARAANRHLGKSDREAAGVLSAAQRHTHFLDSPRMTAVLGQSDFAFSELKTRTATVFLVLPPDRLSTYSRWLRLLVTQSLTDMARTELQSHSPSAEPVLYLLDEFAALGRLAPVERAMGLIAGYGVQLWPILQDVHQLRATYGTRAGTFLSNAGVLQVFGINDHDSARLVSDLLGQETVVFNTMARALDSERSGISFNEQHTARPLLTPDEVRNMPKNRQLLFLAGRRPIMAAKLRYYADGEFRGFFD
jgi:type IV secretion system protein VirD4